MSFRGRYPSKFRKTGNFRGHERLLLKERLGRPFKRKFNQDRGAPSIERFREVVPVRGRGKPTERDGFSGRGRSRPFRKNFSGRGIRPARSRGRFFRGRQAHFRGGRGRGFGSSKEYDERSYERHGPAGEMPEEDEFVEDERSFDDRFADEEENEYYDREEEYHDREEDYYDREEEYYDREEDCVPFEHKMRSPLTIHRRFDGEEYDATPERSPERSRSRIRQSPSLETRHFSELRERSFTPSEGRLMERRDSIERDRPHSIERREHFIRYSRSRGIDERESFVENHRSNSPGVRVRREERERQLEYRRNSIERSRSPTREFQTRDRSFPGSDCERSIDGSSRRSIERQIAFEKRRFQEMLYEKKIHEKRSESSIERYLDDCKRSFENNPKSHSIYPSNSYDGGNHHHRKYKRSLERSLSPSNQPRTFQGLESITIERGRSIERSNSPVRSMNYQRRSVLPSERQRSPIWIENFREIHENNSDSRRRSRSPEFQQRRHLRSGNISPQVSYGRRSPVSSTSSSRMFRKRSAFPGNKEPSFLEERRTHILEELQQDFLGEPEQSFLEERERGFLDNINLQSRDDVVGLSVHSTRERSFERAKPSHSRSYNNNNHFLGVGDGPFSENRSIENKMEYGAIRGEKTKESLALSPVSQTDSFEKRKYSVHDEILSTSEMDLSPISQEGSSDKKKFPYDCKNDRDLSPISPTENLGNYENDKIGMRGSERPGSADSMQKFLAELEEDDGYKSPCDESPVLDRAKKSDLKRGDAKHSAKKHSQDVPLKQDKRKKSLNDTRNPDKVDKLKDAGTSKESKEDNLPKSSYYDFKLIYDPTQKKDEPFKTNNQEKLFNAYENSLLNQSCDAYNENLFQGRYEQSSKTKDKTRLSQTNTEISSSEKSSAPSLTQNNTSEFNPPNLIPMAQINTIRPPYFQDCKNSFRNVPPFMKQNNTYSQNRIEIRPETTSFYPNQTMRPMYPFQQMPSTLPIIPPMTFQQKTLLSNQRTELLQPSKGVVENTMYSRQPNEISNQQTEMWNNQSLQSQNSFGKSSQSYQATPFQNTYSKTNLNLFPAPSLQNIISLSNESANETTIQPFYAVSKQTKIFSSPRHSQELSQSVQQPNFCIGNKDSNQYHSWSQKSASKGQFSSNIPSGVKGGKNPPKHHNVKEVIVISDDEGQSKNLNDDSCDNNYVYMSDGIVIPTAKVVEKYKNCSPSFDVLGKILKGFVIYFGIKEDSELQKDPIEVLQESFSSSECFERLNIEEASEYKPNSEPKKICELRWQSILLSRGEGKSKEEARQVAGIALINALAKTCFTIQAKYGYYNNGRFPRFLLKQPEKPGYYKMVNRQEIIKSVTETVKRLKAKGFTRGVDATHVNAVLSFMDEFFKDPDTHCELMFGPSSGMEYTLGELQTIARHAADNGLQCRWFHGTKKVKVVGKFVCVSRHFSPQALQRYLLAEMGDTVRYRLFPPQGPKIDLLTPSNFYSPNMIKTILNMIGPGGSIKTDIDMDFETEEPFYEDSKTSQYIGQPITSNQSESGWGYPGKDQGNSQSLLNTTPQFQSYKPNPNLRFSESSGTLNTNLPYQNPTPQSTGFGQSFHRSSSSVPNTFVSEGYKRNVPFEGIGGGKRGKWV